MVEVINLGDLYVIKRRGVIDAYIVVSILLKLFVRGKKNKMPQTEPENLTPEAMNCLSSLKFANRIFKEKPHFTTEIFEYNGHAQHDNELYIKLSSFLEGHDKLFNNITGSFRFELLFFCNQDNHWNGCDLFFEKCDKRIMNINIFIIDSCALYPDVLMKAISASISDYSNSIRARVTPYILNKHFKMQIECNHMDSGYFIFDFFSKISLYDPELLYKSNFPEMKSYSFRNVRIPVHGRRFGRFFDWHEIDPYKLPLPLLKNIQNYYDIAILEDERWKELTDTMVCSRARKWKPSVSAMSFNESIDAFYQCLTKYKESLSKVERQWQADHRNEYSQRANFFPEDFTRKRANCVVDFGTVFQNFKPSITEGFRPSLFVRKFEEHVREFEECLETIDEKMQFDPELSLQIFQNSVGSFKEAVKNFERCDWNTTHQDGTSFEHYIHINTDDPEKSNIAIYDKRKRYNARLSAHHKVELRMFARKMEVVYLRADITAKTRRAAETRAADFEGCWSI